MGPLPQLALRRLSFPRPIAAVCPTLRCVAELARASKVRLTFLDGQELYVSCPAAPRRLDFSPNGRYLVLDRERAFDLDRETETPLGGPNSGLAFLSGDRVALSSPQGSVEACRLDSGARVASFHPEDEEEQVEAGLPIRMAASLERGLLACVWRNRVRLYETDRWTSLEPEPFPSGTSLIGAEFSPDGSFLMLQTAEQAMARVGNLWVPQGHPSRLVPLDLASGERAAGFQSARAFAF
ncbi:MAG: hypothetical protein AB1758_10230, partial [Candidatus Eremiobacterota bacterium]